MRNPQKGIFQEGSNKFYYLEYKINFSLPLPTILNALRKIVSTNLKEVNLVTAFGKQAWNILQPNWQPDELIDFKALKGVKNYKIPSTQLDLFFWIHSQDHNSNFDIVLEIQDKMSDIAVLELDLAGFTYHDSRDLTGFIDGSANPKEDDRQLAGVIPENQIGAGGSYVLTQKWVHNLKAFNHLSTQQQEKVVGRTKEDSIELEGDEMPLDSHVSRTDVKVDGKAMKIYRRSAPYGSVTEHGLYFLSFACEIARFKIQLERMFGITEDGLYDKIIEYSKPLTSSYWFAPSIEDLEDLLK
jgi:putative iron-dependent peroxidase